MRNLQILLMCFFAIIVSFSCEKSSLNEPLKTNGFDRKAMLQNYADNLILPAFNNLQTETTKLEQSIQALTQSPSENTLIATQNAWEQAFSVWMVANSYNFGPAGEDGIRKGLVEEIGTFPVSEQKIEANIEKNIFTFSDFNRDNRGFLALEYLIFDLKGNQEVLKKLQNANRKTYLKALANDIKTKVTAIAKEWETYKIAFLSKTGTDVGSSTSQLYNEFVKSYEGLKNFKIGLPLGLRAGQTQTEPNKVEAYYSGKSLIYFKLHFNNLENIWLGKGQKDGLGFKEYLETVEGGKALVLSTEIQLASIKKNIDELTEAQPLSLQIASNTEKLKALHTELQKNTRYFKSDMSSVLGIAITFSSGDGD
jgi:uncharacterized protein